MYARIRSHAAPSGLFGPTVIASEAAEIGWAVDEAQPMRAENAKVMAKERKCFVMMTVGGCATVVTDNWGREMWIVNSEPTPPRSPVHVHPIVRGMLNDAGFASTNHIASRTNLWQVPK